MKNIIMMMALTMTITSVDARVELWPTYIDNAQCLQGNECGRSELGGINPDQIHQIPNVYNALTGYKGSSHKVFVQWEVNASNKPGDHPQPPLSGGIPLMTRDFEETPYVLHGFENTTFNVQYDRGNYDPNSDTTTWGDQGNLNFDWRQVSSGVKLSVECNSKQVITMLRFKMWTNNGFYLTVDRSKLNGISKQKLNLMARNIYLPSISIRTFLHRDNDKDKVSDWINVFAGQVSRLNDRKCMLKFDPSTINFDKLSLSEGQEGKVGSESITMLKLECSGFNYNDHPYQKPIYDQIYDNPKINGNNVVHSVVSAKLTAGNEVNIEGKRKIGLVKDQNTSPSPYLYIEGDVTANQQCGSLTTLELGDLQANPHTFGGPNSDFTGSKEIYWRVCKKPGEVDSGTYKGSATIKIEYK